MMGAMATDPTAGREDGGWGVPRPDARLQMSRRRWLLFLIFLVVAVAAGVIQIRRALWPSAAVADRIRVSQSDLIVAVEYYDPNILNIALDGGQDQVRVRIRRGTSETAASGFWCDVVVPAGGASLPKGRVYMLYDDTQGGDPIPLVPDPVCSDSAPIR